MKNISSCISLLAKGHLKRSRPGGNERRISGDTAGGAGSNSGEFVNERKVGRATVE